MNPEGSEVSENEIIEVNESTIQLDELATEAHSETAQSEHSEESSSEESSADDNIAHKHIEILPIYELNANAIPFVPGMQFNQYPNNPQYNQPYNEQNPYNNIPQRAEPIIAGNDLSTHELAQLCAFMDTDEYPDAEVDEEAIEAILEKAHKGGVIFDSSEARYKENNRRADPNRVTDDELWAIIQISEGEIPDCPPCVLEAALEKVSQGMIKLEKDQNAVQRVVNQVQVAVEEAVEIATSWWDYVPFSGMFHTNEHKKAEKETAKPIVEERETRIETLRQRHVREEDLLLGDCDNTRDHLKKGRKPEDKHDSGCLMM